MTILAIRSDKPKAELYLYDDDKLLSEISWEAHLRLAETINIKIDEILKNSNFTISSLNGIAIYKGPGSFTGLRIGMSVANALAYAQSIPIVARTGENWIQKSLYDLSSGHNEKIAQPEYGAPVHTTKPRK